MTQHLSIPTSVAAYYNADNANDADALAEAFTPRASVRDDGLAHTGRAAIRSWWLAAKVRYHSRAEPLEAKRDGEIVTVRTRVSGQFPDSPATLTFNFSLAGDRIAHLEIS